MTAVTRALLVVIVMILLAACATARRGPESPDAGRPATPAPGTTAPKAQTGRASWYGEPHHGRKTASGEIYDMTQMTAAHRTLPLGTHVRVTNLGNGRSVVVRINDRGPYVGGRIIDLSQAAARELGAIGAGVVSVRVEVLEDAAAETAPRAPAAR